MREDETFLVVVGILAVLVLASAPLYIRFLKKTLARPEKSPASPAPLQKKPVLPFDRAWTTLVKAYATPRAKPAAVSPPPPRTAAPAPQPVPLTTGARPQPESPVTVAPPPFPAKTPGRLQPESPVTAAPPPFPAVTPGRLQPESPVTVARPPVHPGQTGSGISVSDIQSGYARIVNQARSIQDRIRLSREIVTAIGEKKPLAGEEAVRFNENIRAIDTLAGRYALLYGNLRSLMENETAIASPEVLQEYRQKESETIRQIAAVSRQIQPLLNENEDIVAPFVGDIR